MLRVSSPPVLTASATCWKGSCVVRRWGDMLDGAMAISRSSSVSIASISTSCADDICPSVELMASGMRAIRAEGPASPT
ncbi:hypothetical protein I4I73_09005 [Pseudonocardia sp. KRD-184]|uniref:hypothetical protein n=1 Tax=Pseudonocardia oceani TaxID=2792013 RepID=UPI001C4A1153|nr:hypothetical protein [Pseudonocardia oceani]MBW0089178.1 hypothetical protein [Pseudonocardia oceani]MBW0096124.1 hypothetical protein [Pseudonocardia oceani]MBW0123040.1 hypothetical protein [Pseudonocardia oceani]